MATNYTVEFETDKIREVGVDGGDVVGEVAKDGDGGDGQEAGGKEGEKGVDGEVVRGVELLDEREFEEYLGGWGDWKFGGGGDRYVVSISSEYYNTTYQLIRFPQSVKLILHLQPPLQH